MNRKTFLSKLGMGAAFALTATCLGACQDDGSSPAIDVDFTVDLDAVANVALLTNGGYIIQNQVVVAKTLSGSFVAATVVCSHEDRSDVIFQNDEFFCTAHSARFDLDGTGLNSNGSKGLLVYNASLDANLLRVFS